MLASEDHAAVRGMRHDRTLSPAEHDRVEVVHLSATGWSPPGIAAHRACHHKTVRLVLKRFHTDGIASLRRRKGKAGKPCCGGSARRPAARTVREPDASHGGVFRPSVERRLLRRSRRQERYFLRGDSHRSPEQRARGTGHLGQQPTGSPATPPVRPARPAPSRPKTRRGGCRPARRVASRASCPPRCRSCSGH